MDSAFSLFNPSNPIVARPSINQSSKQFAAQNGPVLTTIIKRLSIIIPVYNEATTVSLILNCVNDVKLLKNIQKEVIIVNDCSTDNTSQVIQAYILATPELAITYLQHHTNQGKGAAIHTGIAHATGEYLLIQDADLEYDPSEYNNLLKPVVFGAADVVYGSRFIGGNAHRILFFWHTIGNRFLTFLSNYFNNLNLTDMETGYKLFKTTIIQSIHLQEKRFGFEPEVTAKIARVPSIRIYEIGISYYGRTFSEGKKIGWRDGIKAVYCILKYALLYTQVLKPQKVNPQTVRTIVES